MPQLAMSMTEGGLKEWLVDDGATVAEGQAILAIESDKAVQDVSSPAAGVLRQIGTPGEVYAVGVKIGEIT